MIDRAKLIAETEEEKKLCEVIRKMVRESMNDELKILAEEFMAEQYVREMVKQIIKEAKTLPPPHRMTGINILKDLLKKIVPTLERDFRLLMTDEFQRKSFKTHVLNGIKRTLDNEMSLARAPEEKKAPEAELGDLLVTPEKEAEAEQEGELQELSKLGEQPAQEPAGDVKVDVPTGDAKAVAKEPEKPEKKRSNVGKEDFGVEGEDETGRNVAYETFREIEPVILDSFSMLANDEDRQIFYTYLLKNVSAYFSKFEDSLKTVV